MFLVQSNTSEPCKELPVMSNNLILIAVTVFVVLVVLGVITVQIR